MNIGKGMLGILVKAALLGTLAVGGAASAAGFTVANNVPPAVAKARMTGHHNANEVLDIRVVLPLNNAAQFAQLLHDLYDKGSPNYRHFLTPAQFQSQFGYASNDPGLVSVVKSLEAAGIKVTGFSADNTRIHATAKVSVLEKAFSIAINDYSYQGKTFYAPSSDPRMPAGVTKPVLAVLGLDDAVTYQPHSLPGKAAPAANAVLGPQGYMPADIANFYDLPARTSGGGDPDAGAGVTIAIATAFSFRTQDLDKFWTTSGIQLHNATNGNPVTVVHVDGKITNVLNAETTLDIQRSGSVAPGASIEVYECVNPAFLAFDDEFAEIAADPNVQVVSTSWGAPETEQSLSDIGSEHQSFVTMAAEGITMFAAAGDNSASDGVANQTDVADFPASDPYVVSAGGTFLPNLNDRTSETAWGTLVNGVGDPNGSGAGGADSTLFAEPTYQNSGVPSFVHNTSCTNVTAAPGVSTDFGPTEADLCALASNPSRQNSDMALDGGTGYALYYNDRWVVFIGTSFVAPQLAGYFADVLEQANNASATLVNGRGLGRGNDLIYCVGDNPTTYANDFFDVTNGSNGFPAGTGWDHPTGFGTILDGDSLATDLIGCLPP